MTRDVEDDLIPRQPPGRANRKARSFARAIARLRREGYSCEAIREALEDAGVRVSKSTVQREVKLLLLQKRPAPVAPPSAPPQWPAASSPAGTWSEETSAQSGKDIAASFFKDHITNPLMRERNGDEDRRH